MYLENYIYVTSLLPSALSTVSLIRGHSKPSAFSCLLLRKCLSQFPQAPGCKHPTPSLIVPAALKLFGQTLDRLVTVSSIHYCTSTSDLSTSSSSRGLTTYVGISHLEGGFTLRCLQRLSRPGLATLPCIWYATDTPAASPSRSSRTKDSSSQISYAHAG